MWVCLCLCASEEKEDEETGFVMHEEEREKKVRIEINKIINTHATRTVHIYCSNCVFIHKFTPTDVGDFLLKLCKSS